MILIKPKLIRLCCAFFAALFVQPSFAQQGPANLNVSGALFLPTGAAVTQSNVNFRLEIWDKASTCILYSEDHLSQDLSQSKGGFALAVGRGTSPTNFLESSAVLTSKIFENGGATAGGWPNCASGATFASGDERVIRVYYDLGGGFVAMSPDVPIASSAYALVADTLQGKRPADLIQVKDDVATDLNQANVENVFSSTNYARLQQLLNPSAAIGFGSQRLTNLANPSAAQDAATKSYTDTNLAGQTIDLVDVAPGFGGGKVLTWDSSANKWVAQAPAIAGNAGGDLSGTYPNPTIAALAVGTSKLANDAVTSAKINSTGIATNRLLVTDATTGATVTYANCSNNEILKYVTGTGWQCATVASLSAVTSVAGKSGAVTLNAADITGLGTAAVRNIGTAATEVPELDAGGKLATSTIPLFAGDVTGAIGANIVTQIQGREIANTLPNLNEVLRWNGSRWEPQALTDNVGITALNGDVTAAGTGLVSATINNGAVTTPKMFATPGANRLVATDSTTGATLTPFVCNLNETMQWTAAGWTCASVSSLVGTGYVVNDGNTLGAPLTVGTNDGQPLRFETNNIPKMTILSTGEVGIGTTSPNYRLEINGTVGTNSAFYAGTGGAGTPSYNFQGLTGTGMYAPAANTLAFATSAAEAMRVNSTGYVGIGTTSPSRLLEVGGPVRIAPAALPGTPGAGDLAIDSASGNALTYYNGSSWISLAVGGTGDFKADGTIPMTGAFRSIAGNAGAPGMTFVGDTANGIFAPAANTFAISTSATEKLRVTSAGNVGIGTTAPLYAIDMISPSANGFFKAVGTGVFQYSQFSVSNNGSTRMASDQGWVSQTIESTGSSGYSPMLIFMKGQGNPTTPNYALDNDLMGSIFFRDSKSFGTGASIESRATEAHGAGAAGGDLRFSTASNGSTSATERLRILNGGNVGIGTTAPNRLLEVAGPVRIAPAALPVSPAAGDLAFDSGASNALKYHNGTNWISIGSGTGDFLANGSVPMTGNLHLNDNWLSNDGDNEGLRIDNAGNVGIGTTSPAAGLEVAGNIRSSLNANDYVKLNVDNTFGAGKTQATFTLRSNQLAGQSAYIFDTAAYGAVGGYNILEARHQGATRFTVDSNGVAAAATLKTTAGALNNSANTIFNITSAFGGGSGPVFVFNGNGGAHTTAYKFQDNSVDLMTVMGSGNVGIGVSVPARLLEVAGPIRVNPAALPGTPGAGDVAIDSGAGNVLKWYNGSAWQTVGTSSATGDINNGGNAFGGAATIGTNDAFALNLETSNLPRLTVTSGGNVGIGTTSPSTSFHVAGIASVSNTQSFQVRNAANSGAALDLTASAADAGYLTANSNSLILRTAGSFPVTIATAGVEAMRVDSLGNVGIGTTAPGQKLDVSGGKIRAWDGSVYNVTLNQTGFVSGRTGAGNGNILNFLDQNGAGALELNGFDSRVSGIGSSVSLDGLTGKPIRLGSGTNVLYLGPASGTSTAAQTLTPTIPQNNIAGKDLILLGGQTVAPQPVAGGSVYVVGGNGSGGSADGNVILAHTGSAVRGSVGIGTTAPSRLLEVAGPIRVSPAALPGTPAAGDIAIDSGASNALKYHNGTNWVSIGSGTGDFLANGSVPMTGNLRLNDHWLSNDGGDEGIRIDNAGFVGIGTTTPIDPLHVASATYASVRADNTATNTQAILQVLGDHTTRVGFYDGGTGWILGAGPQVSGSNSVLAIKHSGLAAPSFAVTSTGNVGIGTTAPGHFLEVSGLSGTVHSPFALTNTSPAAGSGSFMTFKGASTVTMATIGNLVESTTTDSSLTFNTRKTTGLPTEKMRITAAGNVGIGTTSPSRLLDVAGPIRVNPAALPGTPAAGDIAIDSGASNALKYHNGTNWVSIGSGTGDFLANGSVAMTGNLRLNSNWLSNDGGNEGIRIDNSGNVGIGISAPSGPLEVGSSTMGTIFKASSTAGGQITYDFTAAGATFSRPTTNAATLLALISPDFSAGRAVLDVRANLGTTNVLWAGADGKVGIGNTSPGSLLTLGGPNPVIRFQDSDYGASTYIDGDAAGGSLYFNVDYGNVAPSSVISFGIDGNQRMLLNASGNLGIGVTSPSRLLEVAGPIRVNPAALPGTPAAGDIAIDSGASNALKYHNGTNWVSIGSGTGDFLANGSVAMTGNLRLNNNWLSNDGDPEGIRVDNAGNVGVGISIPQTKMHLDSTGNTTLRISKNASGTDYTELANTGGSTTLYNRAAGASIIAFDPMSGATNQSEFRFFRNTNTTGSRRVLFFRGDNSLTVDHQIESGTSGTTFFAANGGNIGIGTTGPTAMLDIYGGRTVVRSNGSDPALWTSGKGIVSAYLGASDFGQIAAYDNGGSSYKPLRLDASNLILNSASGGGVGIGTTAPARLLHVAGPMRLQPSALPGTPAAGDITIDSGASNALKYHNGTNWVSIGSGTGDFLANGSVAMTGNLRLNNNWLSNDGGSEGIRVDNSGNVGIGTSAPAQLLDVNGRIKIKELDIANGYATGEFRSDFDGVRLTSLSDTYRVEMMSYSNASIGIDGNANGSTNYFSVFKDNYTANGAVELFRIQDNGNVGIGTTSPAQALDVNGNARATRLLASGASNNPGTPTVSFISDSDTGMYLIGNDTLGFATAGGEKLRIDVSGNLGIGVTAPARLLHVAGPMRLNPAALPGTPAAGDIAIDSGAANALKYYDGSAWVSAGGGGTSLWTAAGSDIFYNTGKVGIGTSSPGSMTEIRKDQNVMTTLTVRNDTNAGSSGVSLDLKNDGGNAAYIWLPSSSSTAGALYQNRLNVGASNSQAGVNILSESAAGDFRLYTGGATATNERLRVTNAGNVGIGTTAPADKLVLDGNSSNNPVTLRIANSATGAGASSNIYFRPAEGSAYNRFEPQNASHGWIEGVDVADSKFKINAYTSSPSISTGTVMTIDTSGNLGIGTTSPARRLHVAGPMRLAPAALPGTPAAGDIAIDSGAANALKYYDGSAWVSAGGGAGSVSGTTNYIAKFTGASAVGNSALYDSGGAIGIGITAPGAVLHVADDYAAFRASSLDNSSYVQINMNNSSFDLDNGFGWFAINRGIDADLQINQGGGVLTVGDTTTIGGGRFSVGDGTNSNSLSTLANFYRKRNDTTAPGAGFAANILFTAEGNTNDSQVTAASLTYGWEGAQTNNTTARDGYLTFSTMLNNSLAERLRITSAGTVGIGTTSPTAGYLLDVNGKGQFSQGLDLGAGVNFWNNDLSLSWPGGNVFVAPKNLSTVLTLGTGGTERVWIAADGKVGIGTTSPAKMLDIAPPANALASIGLMSTGGNGGTIQFQTQGSYGSAVGKSGEIAFNSAVTGGFEFRTVSAADAHNSAYTRMTVTQTGNVGIGTTNPGRLLQVAGPMNLTPAALPGSAAAGDIVIDSGASNALKYYNGSAWVSAAGGGGGSVAGADKQIQFNNSGSFGASANLLYDTSVGGLGVNVTNADFSMEVGPAASGESVVLVGPQNSASAVISGNADRGMFGQNIAVDNFGNIKSVETKGAGVGYAGFEATSGKLKFYSATGATTAWSNITPSPRMLIDTSGNVGIGATTPESLLDVRGRLSVGTPDTNTPNPNAQMLLKAAGNPHLILENVGVNVGGLAADSSNMVMAAETGGITFRTGVNYLGDFTSTGTERMRIENAGNVGIGTTSPTRLLQVAGPIKLTPAAIPGTPTAGDIVIDSGASNALKYYNGSAWVSAGGGGNSSGAVGAVQIAAAAGAFSSDPANFFYDGTNHRLGLGTSAPGYQFDIQNSSADVIASMRSTNASSTTALVFGNNTNANQAVFEVFGSTWGDANLRNKAMLSAKSSSAGLNLATLGNLPITFLTNSSGSSNERMRIDGNGNVGIGTAGVPGDLLTVKKDQNAITRFSITNSTSGAAAETQFTANNNNGDFIAHGIFSTTTTGTNFMPSGGAYEVTSSPWGLAIGATNAAGIIRFGTGGADNERMRIASNGYVGIGTTNPGAALHVVGDIQFTGAVVDVSDRRLKDNIHELSGGLDVIRQIPTYSFTMKDDPKKQIEFGVMAQDMMKVLPDIVRIINPQTGHMGVSYISLIPWSIRAIQDIDRDVASLKSRVTTLEEANRKLEEKNREIEAKLDEILKHLKK